MALTVPEALEPLQDFIAKASGARRATIVDATRLPGGTLQESWRLAAEFDGGTESGTRALVLRVNRPDAVPASLSRAEEFEVMRAVHRVGVATPEPLWSCAANEVLGREFSVMRYLPGEGTAHRLVRDESLDGARERIVERLGEEIAKVQRVTPQSGALAFLRYPEEGPARTLIAELREYLDGHPDPHPAIEWGLRWAERNAPPDTAPVLCHGDFRTGNFLVADGELAGILDWELASWGDPLEDMGWFCVKYFRFGRPDRPAGGLAERAALHRGYARASGRAVEPEIALYWEIVANLRWAVVSMQQAERHLSGREPSLQLALTGRLTAEMELEALELIDALERGAD